MPPHTAAERKLTEQVKYVGRRRVKSLNDPDYTFVSN